MQCLYWYSDPQWHLVDIRDATSPAQCYDFYGEPDFPVSNALSIVLGPDDIPPSPFNLNEAQGLSVSAAIASVWIVAWTFKRFIQTLNGPEDRS